jgi:hypothetical protein
MSCYADQTPHPNPLPREGFPDVTEHAAPVNKNAPGPMSGRMGALGCLGAGSTQFVKAGPTFWFQLAFCSAVGLPTQR